MKLDEGIQRCSVNPPFYIQTLPVQPSSYDRPFEGNCGAADVELCKIWFDTPKKTRKGFCRGRKTPSLYHTADYAENPSWRLVGEVSVKSVFDGKLVNNSRAGSRVCLIPPAGVHISAHALNACCVLGGGGGESATCTCWHSALSWSGCHHGGAEVTGTAWK